MTGRRNRRAELVSWLGAAVALALLTLGAPGVAAAAVLPGAAAPGAAAPGTSTVATLRWSQWPRVAPSLDAAKLALVQVTRPITGGPTVLPVIGSRKAANGAAWLRVRLPGRPNGSTGWFLAAHTRVTVTPWRLLVKRAQRQLVVLLDGRPVRTFQAVVGKPATPTPPGEFFVEESIILPASAVGAPYALALSAHSDVLRTFDGGDGQAAIHGLGNVGGVPGTAVSHGCVRLAEAPLRWLVSRIGPGTPVSIS